MSRWTYGCGCKLTVYVPRGYTYRPITVECGSTAVDGGVNQCESCARTLDPPPAWQAEDAGEADFEPYRADDY